MKRKVALAVVAGVAFMVIAAVFLLFPRPSWNDVHTTELYGIGDEIPDYPTSEICTNFTSWNITRQVHEHTFWLDAENGSCRVSFDFTIKNTSNSTINLSDPNLFAEPNSWQIPLLHYLIHENGSYRGSQDTTVEINYTQSWKQHLIEPIPANGMLMPNQTAQGLLIYKVLDEQQPANLLLKNYTLEAEPRVDLTLLYTEPTG